MTTGDAVLDLSTHLATAMAMVDGEILRIKVATSKIAIIYCFFVVNMS
jgi:hypothetical protein